MKTYHIIFIIIMTINGMIGVSYAREVFGEIGGTIFQAFSGGLLGFLIAFSLLYDLKIKSRTHCKEKTK